jgi:G3E family GTPase
VLVRQDASIDLPCNGARDGARWFACRSVASYAAVHVRVPLVILTGFLGSGKTTLLNRLLARRAGRAEHGKLGVVVNELGSVGIDGALLGGETTRQVELPGGCVCCVLGDELDKTLIELVRSNPQLTAIILETTGVAEPLPITWALSREPVARAVRLATVVTLVDASALISSRRVTAAVDAQIAYADVVMVTKADVVAEAELEQVLAVARELAPRATVRLGSTDDHADWLETVLEDPNVGDLDRPPSPAAASPTQQPHVHAANCRHPDHAAAHGIDSVWITVSDQLDLEELSDQLTDLPDNYIRIKGIVRTIDASSGTRVGGWTAIHRVGLRVSSEPVGAPPFADGRLVALGVGVEAVALAKCVLASSLASE